MLAFFWAWRYAERPATTSLIALACVTAVAFLFRHDHGVYIGVSTIALIGLVHRDAPTSASKAPARYALTTALILFPFFAFFQLTTGVVKYFQDMPRLAIMTPRLLKPITLVSVEWEETISKRFALVHEYLQQHYVTAAQSTFGGDREYAVLVDRSLPPVDDYKPLGLPRYRR